MRASSLVVMTPDALADLCLSLPQAVETFPFGEETSVFKTSGNGKIFALTALSGDPFTVSLKCDPAESRALREEFSAHIAPGYHLNKKHWITIVLGGAAPNTSVPGVGGQGEGVPDEFVEQLVRDSHALVRPPVPRASAR